eukprot:Partr_v1_DN26668_c5_g5_i1_m69227 putative Actin-interacting protein
MADGWTSRLDSEIKAVSSSCKQLIVGLKLFADNEIIVDDVEALGGELRKSLHDLIALLSEKFIETQPFLDASQELTMAIADTLERRENHELIRKVVIHLLQELANVRKSAQISQGDSSPSKPSSPQKFSTPLASPTRLEQATVNDDLGGSPDGETGDILNHYSSNSDINKPWTLFLQIDGVTRKILAPANPALSDIRMLALKTFGGQIGDWAQLKHPIFGHFFELENDADIIDGSLIRLSSSSGSSEEGDIKALLNSHFAEIRNELSSLRLSNAVTFTSQKQSLPANQRSSNFNAKNVAALKPSITGLRRELMDSKKTFRQNSASFRNCMQAARTKFESFGTSTSSLLPSVSGGFSKDSDSIQASTKSLKNSFDALNALVTQLKNDILRGGSPPDWYIGTLDSKLQDISSEYQSLSGNILSTKPLWKRQWEEQLQSIVRNQQELKHSESVIALLTDGIEELKQVISQCRQVLEVKNASGLKNIFVVPTVQDEGHDGLPTVMNEVLSIEVDSARRIEAAERNRKLRQQELALRNENPFEKELSKFQLKNKGLLQSIETIREERDRAAIESLFNSQ